MVLNLVLLQVQWELYSQKSKSEKSYESCSNRYLERIRTNSNWPESGVPVVSFSSLNSIRHTVVWILPAGFDHTETLHTSNENHRAKSSPCKVQIRAATAAAAATTTTTTTTMWIKWKIRIYDVPNLDYRWDMRCARMLIALNWLLSVLK